MEESFIGADKKAPPLLLACSYSSNSKSCCHYRESNLVFLQCEWLLALGKTCWVHVDFYTLECEGTLSMQLSLDLTCLQQPPFFHGERGNPFLKPRHLGQDRKKFSCMMYEPLRGRRRESNSKLPIQLPKVESAGPWLSAKSQLKVKLMSKLVASFGTSSLI